MVNKHSVDYHPSLSKLISRIHTLIFLWTPKRFISPESFLNFFLNLYIPPWFQKCFKLIVLRILQIHLWIKKWICSFLLMPQIRTLPQIFIIIPHAEKNCPFFPNKIFWWYFFLGRKGEEDYGVEKNTKINKGISQKFW